MFHSIATRLKISFGIQHSNYTVRNIHGPDEAGEHLPVPAAADLAAAEAGLHVGGPGRPRQGGHQAPGHLGPHSRVT